MYEEGKKKSVEELWNEIYGKKNNIKDESQNKYKDNFNHGEFERADDEEEDELEI